MQCENCSKEHDGSYGSGRFCSVKCAKSRVFLTKEKRSEINKKISNTIKQKTHELNCIKCGKTILKNINVHYAICDECKNESTKCKICGANHKQCKRPDICKKRKLFPALINYFGFNKELLGTEEALKEFERIKSLLNEEYWDNNLSINDLIRKYGYYNNPMNFSKILNALGIKRRNLTEANLISWKNGKISPQSNSKFKTSWHLTWDNKYVFLRSSYELKYANELDCKQIIYEVEKLKIIYWDSQLCKERTAIPDFYLPETNEIVEIKSNWTFNEQNMKDKFKAYRDFGFKPKLILNFKEIEI